MIPIPIVMRAYNDCALIGKTLEGVTKQTFPYELHIFDNDSTDGTQDIIKGYTD
ncbi:MAG: glycosyltransferase family 2 protein, partial [Spirochaetia bacterium]|nr:glycosyltransferase family 2 protein [Spirochaetia bacterium]